MHPRRGACLQGLTPVTTQIGLNVADFLVADMKRGHIPPQFLPIQSGVGATGNAVLQAMGHSPVIPQFNVYSEVVQDAAINMMLEGKIKTLPPRR